MPPDHSETASPGKNGSPTGRCIEVTVGDLLGFLALSAAASVLIWRYGAGFGPVETVVRGMLFVLTIVVIVLGAGKFVEVDDA